MDHSKQIDRKTSASGRMPRGIRNYNPLNIEKGQNWQGLAALQDDKRFCVFQDFYYGYRAAFRILMTYRKKGIRTVNDIVRRWAPSTENDTTGYIRSVLAYSGLLQYATLADYEYIALVAAMARVECGSVPDYEALAKAWIDNVRAKDE